MTIRPIKTTKLYQDYEISWFQFEAFGLVDFSLKTTLSIASYFIFIDQDRSPL